MKGLIIAFQIPLPAPLCICFMYRFAARDFDSFTEQIVGSFAVSEDPDDDDVAKPKLAATAAAADRTTASLKQAIVACSGERAGQDRISHNRTPIQVKALYTEELTLF